MSPRTAHIFSDTGGDLGEIAKRAIESIHTERLGCRNRVILRLF